MRVGVFLAVTETHSMLRDQSSERVEHIARDVGIGVLVDRETGGRVLNVQHNHAFALA